MDGRGGGSKNSWGKHRANLRKSRACLLSISGRRRRKENSSFLSGIQGGKGKKARPQALGESPRNRSRVRLSTLLNQNGRLFERKTRDPERGTRTGRGPVP